MQESCLQALQGGTAAARTLPVRANEAKAKENFIMIEEPRLVNESIGSDNARRGTWSKNDKEQKTHHPQESAGHFNTLYCSCHESK